MKQKRLIALILALVMLLSLALFTGCGKTLNSQESFDKFLNELFIENVTSDTLSLHYTLKDPSAYGIKDFEPKIYDLSTDGLDEYYADLKDTLKYLNSLDPTNLTEEQQYIYKMLVKYYELNISGEGMDYYGTYLDSISGLPSNMPINFAEYKFYTEKDVTDYIALMNQFPALFEQALDYERTRVEMGLGLSDNTLDTVIEQCEAFISITEDNYLISTFNTRIEKLGLSQEKTDLYKSQNEEAFLNKIVPAYENMIESLKEFKGKCVNDQGLCYFEKGREYYQFLVSYYTGTDYTPEELISRCDSYLSETSKRFYNLYVLNPDVYGRMYESSTYNIDTSTYENLPRDEAEPILTEICTNILNDLQIKMLDYVPALQENNFTISFVEEALEDSLSPAFYMIPPIDDYKNNTIYINLGSVDATSLYSTLAHEGYPGHLYQTVYFNDTNPNPIRNVIQFDGYVEGWAVYMENNSFDMFDFAEYDSVLADFNQAASVLWLALYSRVDLGVNYEGWTVRDVADCMEQNYYNGDFAQELMDMVTSSPATPLKYFVGYTEILSLRDYAKEQLGDKFDLVEFNTALLNIGPMQFSIVKEAIQKYIDAKLAA